MKIDLDARQKLAQRNSDAQNQQGLSDVAEAIKTNGQSNQLIRDLISNLAALNNKFEAQMMDKIKVLNDAFSKNQLTTEQLQSLKTLIDSVNAKMGVFEEIKDKIDKGQTIVFPKETKLSGAIEVSKMPAVDLKSPITIPPFPKEMKVNGEVDIASLPPVTITNLKEISTFISALQQTTLNSISQAMKESKTKIPSSFTVNNELSIKDWGDLIDGIEELKKGFNLLINKEAATIGFPAGSIPVEIQNWMIPQPVNHVSINALRGFALSTAVTVTNTVTPLPSTPLANRRTLIVYNNSSQTVEIGGSTMTFGTGLPIPASSFSPPLDAGIQMIVYGIVSSGTANVRILEVSEENSGV